MANELQTTTDDLRGSLLALGATESLVTRAVKAQTNLSLMENPKLPRIKAATAGLLMDASNPDDVEVQTVTGVILFGAKYKAWYAEKYEKNKTKY